MHPGLVCPWPAAACGSPNQSARDSTSNMIVCMAEQVFLMIAHEQQGTDRKPCSSCTARLGASKQLHGSVSQPQQQPTMFRRKSKRSPYHLRARESQDLTISYGARPSLKPLPPPTPALAPAAPDALLKLLLLLLLEVLAEAAASGSPAAVELALVCAAGSRQRLTTSTKSSLSCKQGNSICHFNLPYANSHQPLPDAPCQPSTLDSSVHDIPNSNTKNSATTGDTGVPGT